MDQDQEDEVSSGGEPAMLLRAPQNATALVGDRVLLKVTYMGHPEPNVRWTRAGRELKNDERTSITSGDGVSCLLLQNITADDSGKYDVCVENIHGADCSYASVSVEGPPDPPSGTPCISTTLDSVNVNWSSSPFDGGRIVDGFAVEYSMVGSDIWTTVIDDCHSLSYTVKGLQPGGRYVFRVRAYNVHGYSKPSLESDIVQLEEHNESSSFEPRIVHVEPGPEFKGRYEVWEELGKGRFGVVHKVIDRQTNRKLAAKFIKCRTAKDKDKVQDEIDIMNLLRHQKLLQLAAAFENPREMIMVMEYISGGELFERVVADDFTLTEKDCILFMRQICEGVAYMHSQNVVHLDLKPENIMCHTRTSHEIKIIDFGLAQKLDPNNPVRVLFGTPEFIPPEIINYEPIGVESDMWSLGVICYVLLSGLSPFMGDNDSETFANITRADYDFDDEAFNTVSQDARDFIGALLVKRKEDRLSAEKCLKQVWLDPDNHLETVILCTDKLKKFIIRRKWQKTGNAIRALGRMATLSASRRNSANSNPNTPRQSLSGTGTLTSMSRMSSLTEQDNVVLLNCDINPSNSNKQLNDSQEQNALFENGETADSYVPLKVPKDIKNENNKVYRSRACSERSDSGISDCSSHLTSSSCTSTPLLGKKFRINEETENSIESTNTILISSTNERRKSHDSDTDKVIDEDKSTDGDKTDTHENESDENTKNTFRNVLNIDIRFSPEKNLEEKPPLNIKVADKIGTFTGNKPTKSTSPTAAGSLKRLPIYTSRTVAGTIKKFDPSNNLIKPNINSPPRHDTYLSRSLDRTPESHLDNKNRNNLSNTNRKDIRHVSRVEKMLEKFSEEKSFLPVPTSPVKFRSPSPSLLRKTQAVIAKEKCNEHYMAKNIPKSPVASQKRTSIYNHSHKLSCPNSPVVNRKEKPKNESFQKAVAFWNLT